MLPLGHLHETVTIGSSSPEIRDLRTASRVSFPLGDSIVVDAQMADYHALRTATHCTLDGQALVIQCA